VGRNVCHQIEPGDEPAFRIHFAHLLDFIANSRKVAYAFIVILSILVLASLLYGLSQGSTPDEVKGWLLEKQVIWNRSGKRCKQRGHQNPERKLHGYWATRSSTWHIPLLRSVVIWMLWQTSGRVGSDWLQVLPWVI